MNIIDKALQTQLDNIQKKTGKTLEELFNFIKTRGLEKHGQIRTMLKEELGIGHGDANTVTHFYLNPPDENNNNVDVLDAIYAGKKEALRPIHNKLMEKIRSFGEFEESPKKTYISLRRKKQFAMIGPATNTRVEVGLNMKDISGTTRLVEQKPGGMCQFKVSVTDLDQVDDELLSWINTAFNNAD